MHSKHLQATVRKQSWRGFNLIHLLPVVLLAFAAMVMVWLWQRMQNPQEYPIHQVKITTLGSYVDVDEIKKTIRSSISGSFFSLNTKQIKNNLLYDPWIKSVSIRRVWPDKLDVSITEQQPLARWGQDGVVSVEGDIFYPAEKSIPQQLPLITAPLSAKDNVLPLYQQFNQLLTPLKLNIIQLTVTQRLAWTMMLSNGIAVNLCRNNTADRFTDFVKLYPQLIGNKAQNVVSINLCYPNGLAIQWKDGKAPN